MSCGRHFGTLLTQTWAGRVAVPETAPVAECTFRELSRLHHVDGRLAYFVYDECVWGDDCWGRWFGPPEDRPIGREYRWWARRLRALAIARGWHDPWGPLGHDPAIIRF